MKNKFKNSLFVKGLKKEKGIINKIIYLYTYLIRFFFKSPTRVIVGSFAFFIILGAVFLSNPISIKEGKNVDFLDALFTSTSAVCVTGLIAFDVGTTLSYFGQFVLMVLIQVGGLGFMTITSFLFLILGKKITLQQRLIIKESFDEKNIKGIVSLINRIVFYTFSVELIVALILLSYFIPIFNGNFAKATFFSVFHSVSSFCNAGFDLMSIIPNGVENSSLSLVSENLNLTIPLGVNIFIGGLGFSVISDLFQSLKNKRKLSTHTKIVLITSFLIIIFGSFLVLLLESKNTLREMNFGYKVQNSIFQVVTSRTAGFSTLDQSKLTAGTRVLTQLFMFVGASPASTGGGIKTTTIIILLVVSLKTIIGKKEINIFKRKLNENLIRRALTVLVFAATSIFLSIIIIGAIEASKGNTLATLDAITFESISAFSTTGLSYGITQSLSKSSRFLLALLMFIGRCGTITIGSAMALRAITNKTAEKISYPDIKIRLG